MLKVLDPRWPDQPFPDVGQALDEPNGLLAVGGCLSVERLVNAYRHGIFPWFSEEEPILWWSPAPRWVMAPSDIKISKSLGKKLRQGCFNVTYDLAFEKVMAACAEPVPTMRVLGSLKTCERVISVCIGRVMHIPLSVGGMASWWVVSMVLLSGAAFLANRCFDVKRMPRRSPLSRHVMRFSAGAIC